MQLVALCGYSCLNKWVKIAYCITVIAVRENWRLGGK